MINDKNFEEIIKNSKKPVLVDFFAEWCHPCKQLSPILEKIEKDFENEIKVIKVNVENIPLTSQKLRIDRIPFVALFENEKIVKSFIGFKTEKEIKEWLEDNEKIEVVIKQYQDYAEKNNLKLNSDKKTVKEIIKGLLRKEKEHGEKYCPCRRVSGDKNQDKEIICPCIFHKKEVEKDGKCFCGLFKLDK